MHIRVFVDPSVAVFASMVIGDVLELPLQFLLILSRPAVFIASPCSMCRR